MQRNWPNENVDLSVLTKQIVQFLESKKFDNVTVFETETGYQVVAGNSSQYKMESDLSITIDGKPANFSVNLQLCKEEKDFKFPMMLAAMFGGGYLFLKKLRSDESWYKFEKDFWQNTKIIIARLKNSATYSQTNESQKTFK